jgi:platelet-activating factor acetylhydrolase
VSLTLLRSNFAISLAGDFIFNISYGDHIWVPVNFSPLFGTWPFQQPFQMPPEPVDQVLNGAACAMHHHVNKPDDVPRNTKQPNYRPPVGLRKHLLGSPLPHYSGPYSVGMMDIEVPVRDPRTFSEIKRHHRHLLELETVLFTVFYPSGFGSGQDPSPEGDKKWSRGTWLPRPRIDVAKGYGKFAGFPGWPTVAWFGTVQRFLLC